MPFGLQSALGTFQQTMEVFFSIVRWKFVFVYLNDSVVFSKRPPKHVEHVWKVLMLLSNREVNLKVKKCSHFRDTMNYLGCVIRSKRLKKASHTTNASSDCSPPTSRNSIPSLGSKRSSENLYRVLVE